MAKRITVVLSQSPSKNPAKRDLEENIVAALLMEPGIDVTVIPNLYDLKADGTGMLCLQGISGDMVLLSWLYPRAAHWILDRNGIRGREGQTMLVGEDDGEGEEDAEEIVEEEETKERVLDHRPLPSRTIWCLDLRARNRAGDFVAEIKRIASETSTKVVDLMGWIGGAPQAGPLQRFLAPTNDTALEGATTGNGHSLVAPKAGDHSNGSAPAPAASAPQDAAAPQVVRIEDDGLRRWYPVIDYSRCTNCMECIDFCLFGVYGVDASDVILVEQQDNCRKGCPACSRVCPENAIIFPQHKTPAIAGSPEVSTGGLKIDLSQLFGAPSEGASALEVATQERDEQLMLAGREAVGMTVGIPKRQEGKDKGPKDELDALMDQLDDLEL